MIYIDERGRVYSNRPDLKVQFARPLGGGLYAWPDGQIFVDPGEDFRRTKAAEPPERELPAERPLVGYCSGAEHQRPPAVAGLRHLGGVQRPTRPR